MIEKIFFFDVTCPADLIDIVNDIIREHNELEKRIVKLEEKNESTSVYEQPTS